MSVARNAAESFFFANFLFCGKKESGGAEKKKVERVWKSEISLRNLRNAINVTSNTYKYEAEQSILDNRILHPAILLRSQAGDRNNDECPA